MSTAIAHDASAGVKLILYKDAKYKGGEKEVSDSVASLGDIGMGDSVSSINLVAKEPIAVYADSYWRGQCWTIRADTPSLSSAGICNDCISSLRTNYTCAGTNEAQPMPPGGTKPAILVMPVEATLYADANYSGKSLDVFDEVGSLGERSFHDTASSIKIWDDYPVALYQDADYGGICKTVWSSQPSLSAVGICNDCISSMRTRWTCEHGPVFAQNVARSDVPQTLDSKVIAAGTIVGTSGQSLLTDGPNLARVGLARQSSTAEGAVAARAIDGDLGGSWVANQVTLTSDASPWLEVDLKAPQPVGLVVLYNRTDGHTERLANATVELSTVPCDDPSPAVVGSANVAASAPRISSLAFPERPTARYVCVRQLGGAVQLAELQAYANASDTTLAGVRGSSSHSLYPPKNAIDGDPSTFWDSVETVDDDGAPYIEIDLKRPKPIGQIILHSRKDCCGDRLNVANVELSLEPCDTLLRRVVRKVEVSNRPPALPVVPGSYTAAPSNSGIKPGFQLDFIDAPEARYVCVRRGDRGSLSIGEIEVNSGEALDNVAIYGTASQSTTMTMEAGSLKSQAAAAIDGSTNGDYGNGSVTATQNLAGGHWFQLALQDAVPIQAVAVHNRTDAKGERLRGVVLELRTKACSDTTGEVLKQVGLTEVMYQRYDFPDTPTAGFVCLRKATNTPLSIAELQVFSTRPLDRERLAAFMAAQHNVPVVAPRALPVVTMAAATDGGARAVSVQHGTLPGTSCTVTPTGATFALACPGLGPIDMAGRIEAAGYALASTATLDDLVDTLPLPSFGAAMSQLRAAMPLRDVRLALDNTNGFFLRGTVDVLAIAGNNAVASGLRSAVATIGGLIPGFATKPTFELYPSVSGLSASIRLKLYLIDSCLEVPLPADLGAGFKYERTALVAGITASTSGVELKIGLDGQALVKPTRADPWLRFEPGIDLTASSGGGASATLRGVVSGACKAGCDAQCGCQPLDCVAAWNPLGISTITLDPKLSGIPSAYVEVGVSASEPPLPIIGLAFDNAKLGSGDSATVGSFAGRFDFSTKDLALQLGASSLGIMEALKVLGASSPTNLVPKELSLKNPYVSIASAATTVGGTSIAKGLRVRGAMDLRSVGVTGSVDASVSLGGFDIASVQAGSFASLAKAVTFPAATLRFAFDTSGLVDRVLGQSELTSWMRPVLLRTFWLRSLSLSATIGSPPSAAASASVTFNILGSTVTLTLDTMEIGAVAKQIALDVASRLAGGLQVAYKAVKAAFDTAYNAAKDAFNQGLTIVFNGISSGVSKAVGATGSAVQKGWKKFVSLF